jgi:hypothetical protein
MADFTLTVSADTVAGVRQMTHGVRDGGDARGGATLCRNGAISAAPA